MAKDKNVNTIASVNATQVLVRNNGPHEFIYKGIQYAVGAEFLADIVDLERKGFQLYTTMVASAPEPVSDRMQIMDFKREV